MMPFLDEVGIDVACIGNHDFDFGIEHLENLIKRCRFPWISSNVKCKENNLPLAGCVEYVIHEHNGIKLGLMGLAEIEWLESIDTFDHDHIVYEPFVDCAKRLTKYF